MTRPQRAIGLAAEPAAMPEARGIRTDAAVAGPRNHTIDQGETFESLAHRYYGSDLYAESLRHLNKDRISGGGLRPGDQLVIPSREELDAVGGWVVQTPSRASAWTTQSGPADGTATSRSRSGSPRAQGAGAGVQPLSNRMNPHHFRESSPVRRDDPGRSSTSSAPMRRSAASHATGWGIHDASTKLSSSTASCSRRRGDGWPAFASPCRPTPPPRPAPEPG